MAKSDKERELLKKVSDLEGANSNLRKSKIQLEKDVEILAKNDIKVKEVQSSLNEKEKELGEAIRSAGLLKEQVKSLGLKNQDLLTEKGQKSEQGETIKSQQQEIEKLIRENKNLLDEAAKTVGEFPIFSDPAKGERRALVISTVLMGKNKRLVVYKTDLANGAVLLHQVTMEGADCVGVDCKFVK